VLEVQRHLREGNTLEDLAAYLGIAVFRHPGLPLVGLKYQAHAPKAHPLVRECRGLVLEADSWDVVAKPFDRFFNTGEDPDAFSAFNWSRCWCQAKEDGSLLIVYAYQGGWHVNTSGSFGGDSVSFSGWTWAQLFWTASGLEPERLNHRHTYVFELCSPYTKVVRAYPQTVAYLLSMFDPATCRELPIAAVDEEAAQLRVPRPEMYSLSSMDEITALLTEKEQSDPTFEGVIIRGDTDLRFKIKTGTYLAAHHAEGGGNLFNPRRIVPLILSDEVDEVVAYYPELRETVDRIKAELIAAWDELHAVWERTWKIEDQKAFAQAIARRTPFSGLLFTLRKECGADQSEDLLRQLWRRSDETILKALYKRPRR